MVNYTTSGNNYKCSSITQKPEDKITFGASKPEEKISFGASKSEEKVTFGTSQTGEKVSFGTPKTEEKISFGTIKADEIVSFTATKATEKVTPAPSKSEETGEQESKTTFKSFFGKPVDLKTPIFGKSLQSTSNVPDVLKGQSFVFGKVEQKSLLLPLQKDVEKSKENVPQPAKEVIELKSEKNETKLLIQSNNAKLSGQPTKGTVFDRLFSVESLFL